MSVAWVVTEPDGPRRISETVLTALGIDFETDFEMAGTWDTAAGVAGHDQPVRQVLWKPVRPASAAMEAGRDEATASALGYPSKSLTGPTPKR